MTYTAPSTVHLGKKIQLTLVKNFVLNSNLQEIWEIVEDISRKQKTNPEYEMFYRITDIVVSVIEKN